MTDTLRRPATIDAPAPTAPATAARDRRALSLLLAAVFVVVLNETMMGVALPRIQEELHIDATQGQWLTTAFALTMAVVIPTTGWLIQRLTTRRLFVIALSSFGLGTLLAAVAPAFEVLVAGRVIQGAGTAIMMPLMMTTVMTVVPVAQRGRVMGRVSIVMSVAPAVGPIVSGALIQVLPWQGLFWVMLPIAVGMLVVGARLVPNLSDPRAVPLDVASVAFSALAFSALVFGLSEIGAAASDPAAMPAWIPITVGLVALGVFVARQLVLQRTDAALLDLRTFRSRGFTFSLVLLASAMIPLFGAVIVLPQVARYMLGLDPIWIGALLLPGGLLMGLAGPVVGRMYDRFGARPLVVPGAVALSASLWTLAFGVGIGTSWVVLLVAHVVLSLALAFLFTPAFSTALGSLPPTLYSHGSATISTVQQVAAAAGTAIFVALYATGIAGTDGAHPAVPSPAAAAAGSHLAFMVGGLLSLVVIVVALLIRRPGTADAHR